MGPSTRSTAPSSLSFTLAFYPSASLPASPVAWNNATTQEDLHRNLPTTYPEPSPSFPECRAPLCQSTFDHRHEKRCRVFTYCTCSCEIRHLNREQAEGRHDVNERSYLLHQLFGTPKLHLFAQVIISKQANHHFHHSAKPT